MNLFGDPRAPRRNLWGGLILTALGALMAGMAASQLAQPELWPGARRSEWIQLALSILMTFGGVMQFRLGISAVRFPELTEASDTER